jgi:hypothetical protein
MDQYLRIDPHSVLWELPTQKVKVCIDRFKIAPIDVDDSNNYKSHMIDSFRYMLNALKIKSELCGEPLKPIFQQKHLTFRVCPWISSKMELKQFRFPKSKKKRIRNKWSKKSTNSKLQEVEQVVFIKETMTVFGSQKTIDRLKKHNNGILRR